MEKIDLNERFTAIRGQEEKYQCTDYLSSSLQVGQAPTESQLSTLSSDSRYSSSTTSSTSSNPISAGWRQKICEWNFQVIDRCNLDRETASVSLNYLDRYLSTHHVNMETLQLVALTSLYLAIKLYESVPSMMSLLIDASRGRFNKDRIVLTEESILWCVMEAHFYICPFGRLKMTNIWYIQNENYCTLFIAQFIYSGTS